MGWLEDQKKEADQMAPGHYCDDEGVPGIRMRDRKCTDPLMCCLFIVWIFIMVVISGYAFSQGDIDRLAFKFDMDLQNCTQEYPRKLFTRIIPTLSAAEMASFDYKKGFNVTGNSHWSVCVKKCPKKDEKVEYMPTSKYNQSNLKLLPSNAEKAKLVLYAQELEKWDKYETQDLMGFCLPTTEELKTKGQAVYE